MGGLDGGRKRELVRKPDQPRAMVGSQQQGRALS